MVIEKYEILIYNSTVVLNLGTFTNGYFLAGTQIQIRGPQQPSMNQYILPILSMYILFINITIVPDFNAV
jgi:hypothetical protein